MKLCWCRCGPWEHASACTLTPPQTDGETDYANGSGDPDLPEQGKKGAAWAAWRSALEFNECWGSKPCPGLPALQGRLEQLMAEAVRARNARLGPFQTGTGDEDAAQPGQNAKTDFAREGVSYLSARTVVRLCIENLGMQKAF